jgi:hypothetical protein
VATLRLSQSAARDGTHRMEVSLTGLGAPVTAVSVVPFVMSADDRERVRWYLEDFLEYPLDRAPAQAAGVEARLDEVGSQLFSAVFAGEDARDLWAQLRKHLPKLRVEVASDVADSAGLPWELLRDPKTGIRVALQAASFVRVHRSPATPVRPRELEGKGRLRVLLVICRPAGGVDVPFRSVASKLVATGEQARDVLDLDVLRPPTFARLTAVLEAAAGAVRSPVRAVVESRHDGGHRRRHRGCRRCPAWLATGPRVRRRRPGKRAAAGSAAHSGARRHG